MLRLTRLPLPHRLSLRRLGTAATAPSTSPSAYTTTTPPPPPPSPLRPRSSLYSQPTLPPIAAPLPVDGLLYSSPTVAPSPRETPTHEQIAVLDACLTSGEITRAEEVASRIEAAWGRKKNLFKQEVGGDPGSLSMVLPPRVHADFLRAYFLKARSTDNERLQASWVVKAWTYYDTLTDHVWWDRRAPRANGAVDEDVVAVMLKGLVAAGPEFYNPSADSPVRQRKLTSILASLQGFGLGLGEVLRADIFRLDSDKFLGPVDAGRVLDAFEETGKGSEVFREFEASFESLRDEFASEKRRQEAKGEVLSALELDPTRSVRPFSKSCMNLY